MAKIIRLNESDIERLVRKIIKEEEINEIGVSDFSDTETIGKGGDVLRPAVATLKGKRYIVVIDKGGRVFGYGPQIGKGMDKEKICRIADKLVQDWEEEALMNEVDSPDFENVQPITFCSK
jgi:hypothetical protein